MLRTGLALMAALAFPAAHGAEPAGAIDRAFARLYNFDFSGAHRILDAYVAAHPQDPTGYGVRSAVCLFEELHRLGILEAQFFADDKRLTDKKKIEPDPAIRARLYQSINDAQSRAEAALASKPDDEDALFALCTTQGVMVDYVALVERRHLGSLSLAKRSNSCAQRLLKINPQHYDAYVTTGFTEYLVGSLPFIVRWFVRFDGVTGNKEEGMRRLQIAAESGRFFKPFAKLLLAMAYLREKKPLETERLLAEFSKDFPENALVRRELARLSERAAGGPVGQK